MLAGKIILLYTFAYIYITEIFGRIIFHQCGKGHHNNNNIFYVIINTGQKIYGLNILLPRRAGGEVFLLVKISGYVAFNYSKAYNSYAF